MFYKVFDTGIPEFNLMAYFWQNLRNDLQGRGCPSDETPPACAGQTYMNRAKMEREMLQTDALVFLDTTDFINWAQLSGADPEALREVLLHEYQLNS